ncbi:zf-DHHC-domain-containing protein [Aulographum hederae CBS 113979]|uniref:Palmitoyltransferase n=1 Tax=Aulographum hederae CBS 113979 TaxID=1176131 RepID=A0A6G1H767_9PEZI|nr:zf-DHHC-domain-containing protein [Aulographum hederae CBS 113979]
MSSLEAQRKVNAGASRLIPLLLFGILGYCTWVLVDRVCIHYLLNPPSDLDIPRRTGAAIAILILYFVLLPLWALPYIRTLQVIVTNPGFTELRRDQEADLEKGHQPSFLRSCGNTTIADGQTENDAIPKPAMDRAAVLAGTVNPPPGLDEFWTRDAFMCDRNGLPIFCNMCNNWKPDRTHHCSEVNRCVRRMDHFCPWAGGIISETNMKFFIQFLCYATIFTAFLLITMAVLIADRRQKMGSIEVHWVVVLGLSALFFLFGAGMAGNTVMQALQNTTTVEKVHRGYRTDYIAVLIDPTMQQLPPAAPESTWRDGPTPYVGSIVYPLRPSNGHSETWNFNPALRDQQGHELYPNSRRFAVLCLAPSQNPWDISPLRNMKSLMGEEILDWFFPIKYSPYMVHDYQDGYYPFGAVLERLKADAGLTPARANIDQPHRRRRRRRRRRHSSRSRTADGQEMESRAESGDGSH